MANQKEYETGYALFIGEPEAIHRHAGRPWHELENDHDGLYAGIEGSTTVPEGSASLRKIHSPSKGYIAGLFQQWY